jgi:hypothetical protein
MAWHARVILSSDEEDNTPEQLAKTLRTMGVGDTAVLEADDYHQKYTLRVNMRHTYAPPTHTHTHTPWE